MMKLQPCAIVLPPEARHHQRPASPRLPPRTNGSLVCNSTKHNVHIREPRSIATTMSTDEIDTLLEQYLTLLDKYTALREELTTLQSSVPSRCWHIWQTGSILTQPDPSRHCPG